jgi:hypothetical protein
MRSVYFRRFAMEQSRNRRSSAGAIGQLFLRAPAADFFFAALFFFTALFFAAGAFFTAFALVLEAFFFFVAELFFDAADDDFLVAKMNSPYSQYNCEGVPYSQLKRNKSYSVTIRTAVLRWA